MKNVADAMLVHIQQGVTTLCTVIEIVRQDGKTFGFTDHDQAVTYQGNVYIPQNSFSRSSITTTIELEVDQVEIRGILNNGAVSRSDVSAGLFDYANTTVSVVNWANPDMGAIRMRTGWLGEVVMNEDGTFEAEIRGMAQAYSYRIGQSYTPECRADLGDKRCKLPLDPPHWSAGVQVATGASVIGDVAAASGYFNLNIQNASFDDDQGTLAVAPSGWTGLGDTVNGRWEMAAQFYGMNAKEGGFAAFMTDGGGDNAYAGNTHGVNSAPHTVSNYGMYQDVSLAQQQVPSTVIDTGLCRLYATVYLGTASTQGSARFQITCLDQSLTTIGNGPLFDTGYQTPQEDTFVQKVINNVLIPAGTRTIRLTCLATKLSKWTEGGAFDTITVAINDPTGTLGSSDTTGGVCFVATEGGVTGNTQPKWNNAIGATTTDGSVVWTTVKSWKTSAVIASRSSDDRTCTLTGVTAATGYYNGGLLVWETGANAGRAQEIKTWDGTTLTYFERPFFLVNVGDRCVVHPGCDRTISTCETKFGNVLNFRGEPYVPGQDVYYGYPSPSS